MRVFQSGKKRTPEREGGLARDRNQRGGVEGASARPPMGAARRGAARADRATEAPNPTVARLTF